ncbi:MAG TPA: PKD domain-containing protein, partial [Bacteroidetes bacterium]|nr:PKD domain-containing protein [Bacteroidota bacterium]
MKIRVFISTFLVLLSLASTAQSTKGKDFWLGFMMNLSTDSLSVFISSETNTTGTISMPKAGWSQSFAVTANTTTKVAVPPLMAVAKGGGIENKGIHIVTGDDVSVFALNYTASSSDAAIIFPTNALGDDYYITTCEPDKYPSEFLIVATSDSTSINIEPTANILGGVSAGNSYNVILNAGEVFFCMSQDDLTGTRIYASSNNGQCGNFAVFSGNKCEFVGGCGWCDHLYEQMMPLKTWGKNYITIPLKTRSGDFIKILASQDATQVNVNNNLTINLNKGQHTQLLIDSATHIMSNKPISVVQFSRGGDCDNTDADPFMIVINPIEQVINKITFNAFNSSIINNYYVNIITKTSAVSLITLDGINIDTAFSTLSVNPLYSIAQLDITQGNHTMHSDSGFIAYIYGYGTWESYGYVAGANLNDMTNTFSYISSNDPICPGDSLLFSAQFDSSVFYWQWDFENGISSTAMQASQVYNDYGQYDVSLIIHRTGGCAIDIDTFVKTIDVTGPVSDITSVDSICYGQALTISATADSSVVNFVWNTGDTAFSITPVPDSDTTYWAMPFSARCPGQADSVDITVVKPLASFSALDVCLGDTSYFSDLSYSTHSSLKSFAWDFGEPVSGALNISNLQNTQHAYLSSGIFDVSLNIVDSFGCTGQVLKSINVHSLPIAGIVVNDTCFNESSVFTDTSTSASNIISWDWSFGDGSISGIQNPDYIYRDSGNYLIGLVITDIYGCKDSTADSLTIYPLPVIDFDASLLNGCVPLSTSFYELTQAAVSWTWDFGDGSTGQGANVNHVYENPGTFSVSLTALSSRGCSNDMLIDDMIEVYPLSVALYDNHPGNVSIFEPLYYFQNL